MSSAGRPMGHGSSSPPRAWTRYGASVVADGVARHRPTARASRRHYVVACPLRAVNGFPLQRAMPSRSAGGPRQSRLAAGQAWPAGHPGGRLMSDGEGAREKLNLSSTCRIYGRVLLKVSTLPTLPLSLRPAECAAAPALGQPLARLFGARGLLRPTAQGNRPGSATGAGYIARIGRFLTLCGRRRLLDSHTLQIARPGASSA